MNIAAIAAAIAAHNQSCQYCGCKPTGDVAGGSWRSSITCQICLDPLVVDRLRSGRPDWLSPNFLRQLARAEGLPFEYYLDEDEEISESRLRSRRAGFEV
jgi:hypothetical protein